MRVTIFIIYILFVSCQRHSRHEIVDSANVENNNELVAYLTDLIDEEKANAQIYFKRAEAFLKLGNERKALIDIQKALEIAPTDPAFYLFLSTVYNAQNKPSECIRAALQAEQRGLQNYELYRLLAINYLAIDEAENAKKAIDRLMSFNRNAETLCLKGDIFLQLTDTLEAIKSYNGAIQEDNVSLRAYRALHSIFKESQPAIAEQFVDQYLRVDGGNDEMKLLKARMLSRRESYDSALSYMKSVALDSNNFDRMTEIGEVYYSLNRFDSSLLLASKVIHSDTSYRKGALLAARSFDKLQQYNNAKKVYEYLVGTDSTDLIVATELDKLNRKVAYLWRLKQQELVYDSIRKSAPPVVERKELNQ